jgi:isopenicillin N synthase-like dioxygenase
MSSGDVALPIIDLSGYIAPKSAVDRERVIAEVRDAAHQYGFFQVRGHGVPLSLQKDLLRCMDNVFNLPKEEKLKMSFLADPCRRGYEASGMSHREGDALPDAKEVRTIPAYLANDALTTITQVLLCGPGGSSRGALRLLRP